MFYRSRTPKKKDSDRNRKTKTSRPSSPTKENTPESLVTETSVMIYSQAFRDERFSPAVALFSAAGLIRTTAGIHQKNPKVLSKIFFNCLSSFFSLLCLLL